MGGGRERKAINVKKCTRKRTKTKNKEEEAEAVQVEVINFVGG